MIKSSTRFSLVKSKCIETSVSGQDRVRVTGFTFLPETIKTPGKLSATAISDAGPRAARAGFWREDNGGSATPSTAAPSVSRKAPPQVRRQDAAHLVLSWWTQHLHILHSPAHACAMLCPQPERCCPGDKRHEPWPLASKWGGHIWNLLTVHWRYNDFLFQRKYLLSRKAILLAYNFPM